MDSPVLCDCVNCKAAWEKATRLKVAPSYEDLEKFSQDALRLLLEVWCLQGAAQTLGPAISAMIDRGVGLFPPPRTGLR